MLAVDPTERLASLARFLHDKAASQNVAEWVVELARTLGFSDVSLMLDARALVDAIVAHAAELRTHNALFWPQVPHMPRTHSLTPHLCPALAIDVFHRSSQPH